MKQEIRVGIIGDFNPDSPSHRATDQAIRHAADVLTISAAMQWLPTPSLEETPAGLEAFDAHRVIPLDFQSPHLIWTDPSIGAAPDDRSNLGRDNKCPTR